MEDVRVEFQPAVEQYVADALRQSQPDLQRLQFSGKTSAMSSLNDDLIRAIELALADDWDAAHNIVQQHEGDSTAAWIHAVLHKIEGDDANSRYWYRRADRMARVADKPREELVAIRDALFNLKRRDTEV